MEKAVALTDERKSIKEVIKEAVMALRGMYPQLEKVPDEEIQKALLYCKKAKLDPFRKEVHFIPYGKSLQVVTSYIEYIKRGERSGKLDGWTVKVEGKTKDDLRATVVIYRKDWTRPFEWTVFFKEVAKNTPTWESMPVFMLKKATISQAFRLAFPEETGFLPGEESEIVTADAVSVNYEETSNMIEHESTEVVVDIEKPEKTNTQTTPQTFIQKTSKPVSDDLEKEQEPKLLSDEISKETKEKIKQINQGQINIIIKELSRALALEEEDPVIEVVKNLNYKQAVDILKKIREKKHKEAYDELLKLTKMETDPDLQELFEYEKEEDEDVPF